MTVVRRLQNNTLIQLKLTEHPCNIGINDILLL